MSIPVIIVSIGVGYLALVVFILRFFAMGQKWDDRYERLRDEKYRFSVFGRK